MKKKKLRKALSVIAAVVAVLLIAFFVHGSAVMQSAELTKLSDYLYCLNCGSYDYGLIGLYSDHFASGACTSVRVGDYHARNFDWNYSEEVEFVVRTEAGDGRFATIGVAALSGLERDFVESGAYSVLYQLMPFFTVDGMNEKGLCVNTNIVPLDCGVTTGTNPGGERVCSAWLCRYLLDYADSVESAISLMQAADIYSMAFDGEISEFHLMISDPEKTIIAEFIDNELVIVEDEYILTNYFLGLDDYTPRAQGIERFEAMAEVYGSLSTPESIMDALYNVRASRENDFGKGTMWYSDFYSYITAPDGEEFTMNSDRDKFIDLILADCYDIPNTPRDGRAYITTHCSLFDMRNLTLTVCAQEDRTEFVFPLAG